MRSPAQRQAANALVDDRYRWRGYRTEHVSSQSRACSITLTAEADGTIVGTITVVFDGPSSLAADDAFAAELTSLRSQGLRLCEFGKLAVRPLPERKNALAALFHAAFTLARDCNMLIMEVNPRHVRYYQRMFGARIAGAERTNQQVGAPSVLLSLSLDDIRSPLSSVLS